MKKLTALLMVIICVFPMAVLFGCDFSDQINNTQRYFDMTINIERIENGTTKHDQYVLTNKEGQDVLNVSFERTEVLNISYNVTYTGTDHAIDVLPSVTFEDTVIDSLKPGEYKFRQFYNGGLYNHNMRSVEFRMNITILENRPTLTYNVVAKKQTETINNECYYIVDDINDFPRVHIFDEDNTLVKIILIKYAMIDSLKKWNGDEFAIDQPFDRDNDVLAIGLYKCEVNIFKYVPIINGNFFF